jgi:predicted transcriptional regulator
LPESGQLESAIMDVLWSQDQALAVLEVRDRLQHGRPLRREKRGRAWRYWPRERRPEHDARLMAETLRSGSNQLETMRVSSVS